MRKLIIVVAHVYLSSLFVYFQMLGSALIGRRTKVCDCDCENRCNFAAEFTEHLNILSLTIYCDV